MIKKAKKDASSNLIDLFDRQVVLRPRDLALQYGELSLSYEELNQNAEQLACYLFELGVKEDTPVALVMDRSIELFIAILAILKAGGAYVPLDPSHPEERLLLILNEGQIPILISTREKLAKLKRYQGKALAIDSEIKNIDKPKVRQIPSIKPHHLAYIIYTSGSTGKPKGVLIEHGSIVNYTLWFATYSGILPQELIDFSANHAFDVAVSTSIVPLLLGLTVIICEEKIKKDPRLYLEYLEAKKIQNIKITPGYFNVLLHQVKAGNYSLKYLKNIILGGENLLVSDCASWLALFPHHVLFNEYGPTETTVAVTSRRIISKNIANFNSTIPIGKLIPNCEFYILDQQKKPVAEGEIGELYLGGICLARGYLNDKKLTEKFFIKNPFSADKNSRLYKTGDLCRVLASGELDCIGRIDNQVKIRGYRIEPSEIENLLILHPAIKSALVNVVENGNKEKFLVAYFVLKNKQRTPLNGKKLAHYLSNYLPDYMIPSHFVEMDCFPLNKNDKIDRKILPLPAFNNNSKHQSPTNSVEKILCEIWSDELGFKSIGVQDNFFELGGHSLSAARIISTIAQVLDKEVSLQHFYQYPTISALGKFLETQKKNTKKRELPEKIYHIKRNLPLSDFQFTLWLSTIFEPKAKKLTICGRKRFQGYLDEKKLNNAFNLTMEKHEVLAYQVSTFSPSQHIENAREFKIQVKNLEAVSEEISAEILEDSFAELINYRWKKNHRPLIARMFYLKGGKTELQLGMPHILFDNFSPDIIFADLSHFYLTNEVKSLKKDKTYREYLFAEQAYIKNHLDHDQIFWERYLQEASLFVIPKEAVVTDMRKSKQPYSRYTEIPKKLLDKLRNFCTTNHISLDQGLSGILLLALSNCCGALNTHSPICFNKVKSTRYDSKYDNTLGCFLSLELIKLSLDPQQTLESICQQIHRSMIATSPYQGCSNLVKLASVSSFRKPGKLKQIAVNTLIFIHNLLFPATKLNKKIVSSSTRISQIKANQFLININILPNFLKADTLSEPQFGLEEELTPNIHHDLLNINNMLDVCFMYMADQKPYMVISANLTAEFHDLLRQEILRLCNLIQ